MLTNQLTNLRCGYINPVEQLGRGGPVLASVSMARGHWPDIMGQPRPVMLVMLVSTDLAAEQVSR